MKKSAQKTLSIILCMIMLFGAAPLNGIAELDFAKLFVTEANADDDIETCGKYQFKVVDGEAVITKCSDYTYGILKIPNSLNGYPVVGIKSCSNRFAIKIVIPDGVRFIEGYAFQSCHYLTEVEIPDTVKYIGELAFNDTINLTNIFIGENVEKLDKSAFVGTGYYNNQSNWIDGVLYLSNHLLCAKRNTSGIVNVKSGTKYIDEWAFQFCNEITEINLPNTVRCIGEYAFYNCKNLQSINLPEGIEYIEERVFGSCTSLTNIDIPVSVKDIGDFAFGGCIGLESIIIPDSVTNIGTSSFSGCTGLQSITIGQSVESIGDESFKNCSGLTSVTIPDRITSIGQAVFRNCTGLTSVTIPDNVKSIGSFAFYGCTGLTSVTIPDSVTCIGGYTFYGCTSLTSVIIGNSVTSIGYYLFSRCTALRSINIPDSVTSIGEAAFWYCTGLKSINFPNTITTIEGYAFSYCTNLTTVGIPNSVTSIGERAFYYCYNIKNLDIPNSVTSIGEDAFYLVNNIRYSDKMTAPGSPWGAKAVDAYIEGNLMYENEDKLLLLACSPEASGTVTVPGSVLEVGDYCFTGCENISALRFESENITFSETMLSGCKKPETVESANTVETDGVTVTYTVPLTRTRSGMRAASNVQMTENGKGILHCNTGSYGEYTVPDSISFICENAFADCTGVNITIPDSVTLRNIGRNAFTNSKTYKERDKTKPFTIGRYFIEGLASLTGTFTIGSAIVCIADGAFSICKSMTGFAKPTNGSLKYIGRGAFSGCTELKTISCTELEYVGVGAFADSGIESSNGEVYIGDCLVSVPKDVTEYSIREGTTCIAEEAFAGCNGLKTISIPDTITAIPDGAFKECVSLSSITLNDNVTSIGKNAFRDCISLESITIPASVTEIGDYAFYHCVRTDSLPGSKGSDGR